MGLFDQNSITMESATQIAPGSPLWENWVKNHITNNTPQKANTKLEIKGDALLINSDIVACRIFDTVGISKYLPNITSIEFNGELDLGCYLLFGWFDAENIIRFKSKVIRISNIRSVKNLDLDTKALECSNVDRFEHVTFSNETFLDIKCRLTEFHDCAFHPESTIHYHCATLTDLQSRERFSGIIQDVINQLDKDSPKWNESIAARSLAGYIFRKADQYSVKELFGISCPVKQIWVSFEVNKTRVYILFTPSQHLCTPDYRFTKDGWFVKISL